MFTKLLLLKAYKKMLVLSYVALGLIMLAGCATPIDTTPSHTKVLTPDQDDGVGGSFIESSDIRTIAQQVCTTLLSLPEISNNPDTMYIATEKIRNSTRYMVDTNLLLRRLRLDLNKYSQGQLRFFAQGSGQIARTRILREREQTDLLKAIDEVARYVASSEVLQNSDKPVQIVVNPVANTNLFNMNADSFSSLLRTKIKEHAGAKVLFAKPGSDTQGDYTLTGEFFAQSIKREGVANTVEDLKWAQENQDKWYSSDDDSQDNTVYGNQINLDGSTRRRIKVGPNITYKLIDPALWNSPNVTKTFNVMLVNNEDMVVLEKVVNLEEQIKSGEERANYILTGDISSLSKASVGQRSDYVLISFYLIDPISNEMLWEYGYEVKRVTSRSVLYR
jgi:PBP1b-binding outer membrane lipoprotein LpoB